MQQRHYEITLQLLDDEQHANGPEPGARPLPECKNNRRDARQYDAGVGHELSKTSDQANGPGSGHADEPQPETGADSQSMPSA